VAKRPTDMSKALRLSLPLFVLIAGLAACGGSGGGFLACPCYVRVSPTPPGTVQPCVVGGGASGCAATPTPSPT
jgi:hypothetical protein